MNAFLDKRDFMAELEEFEKHLLRSGITTQSEDGALADLPPLVARREDARQSVVEPQGPRPVEARRNDGEPAKSEFFQKLESVQRTDFAAIEAELKHERRHAAGAEPLGTAASNAIASLAGELKSQRHGAETVVSGPVGVADKRAASRRSLYVIVGIVVAGLAGLGLGKAFWNDASNPPDASSINSEAGLAKPPSQVTTSADIPVSPPPATSGGDAEQLVDTSRPQAETPPAVARQGETGPADQTASGARASPIATQMQGEPVGMATPPEPKKAETASVAPPDAALRPSDAPAQAAAASPLPARTPAAAAPASTPKTAPRARKAPKPSVAAKSGDPRQPGRIAKPAKAAAAQKVAQPDSTQSPITQPEAQASKPAAAPESSGAFAYVQRAQQAVGSLAGVVKNWVGMDTGPRP